MKPKHTPGPWIFAYGSVYQGDQAETVEEFAGRIAMMDRDNPHTQPTERDANARLIASAPELLGACKALLSELQNALALVESCDLSEDQDRALEIGEAAIAKAEGREQ